MRCIRTVASTRHVLQWKRTLRLGIALYGRNVLCCLKTKLTLIRIKWPRHECRLRAYQHFYRPIYHLFAAVTKTPVDSLSCLHMIDLTLLWDHLLCVSHTAEIIHEFYMMLRLVSSFNERHWWTFTVRKSWGHGCMCDFLQLRQYTRSLFTPVNQCLSIYWVIVFYRPSRHTGRIG